MYMKRFLNKNKLHKKHKNMLIKLKIMQIKHVLQIKLVKLMKLKIGHKKQKKKQIWLKRLH